MESGNTIEQVSINDILTLYRLQKATDDTTDQPPRCPIFLSIDFEAYERNQNIITEIGISVLDTADLLIPDNTGDIASNATPRDADSKISVAECLRKMKHAHYIINEHKRMVNKRFVKGCPNDFNFGTTQFISKHTAARLLRRAVAWPTALHTIHAGHEPQLSQAVDVIFVGHSNRSDVAYARTLGYSFPSSIQEVDTQIIRNASARSSPSLTRLLTANGIEHSYLHNAGNDAAYTLQAMVTMAARETASPGRTIALLGYR